MQKHIFLDIGNTNTKWKVQDEYFVLPTENFEFDKLLDSSKIWVSNVSEKIFNFKKPYVCIVESQKKYKSLINAYRRPKSLGSDRWLGMIAAYEKSKDNNFIVIDVGSAITIDLVNKSGMHLGGVIIPGLEKIRQTFNNFLISSDESIIGLGKSTEEAWTIGTFSMIPSTINLKIKELRVAMPDAIIYITGGGYSKIREFLEFDHNHSKNLVLDGLEFYADSMR